MVVAVELQSIKNLATAYEIHSPKSGVLEVVEFTDHTWVFQSIAQSRPGQLVQLIGRFRLGESAKKFESTAKIVSVTPGPDGYNRYEVHLHQFDKEAWEEFLKALRERQTRAETIFTSMRGDPNK